MAVHSVVRLIIPPTPTYSDWNISITGGALAANYTTASSFVSTSGTNTTSDASNLILALNGSDLVNNYQLLRLTFAGALTGTSTDATSLVQGTFPAFGLPIGSITSATGNIGNGPFNAREAINGSPSSVTAVPWETDALSVIGVTTLFGFGVWTKRKRKVDLSK